jgi:hypothetical protein
MCVTNAVPLNETGMKAGGTAAAGAARGAGDVSPEREIGPDFAQCGLAAARTGKTKTDATPRKMERMDNSSLMMRSILSRNANGRG